MTPPNESRYSRHELLPQWGADGQEKLRIATVLIVGCGALGTHQAQLLARAGVGAITIVDRDLPETHNLQRQVLFDEDDVASGLPKAEIAARKLRRINSGIEITSLVLDVTHKNIEGLVKGKTLVLDGTDNFETRYLINDACVKNRVPWVYGGVISAEGMVMAIRPGIGPCLRCALPEKPPPGSLPTCETAGVLCAAPAMISAMQVAEAFKILLGREDVLDGMLHADLWNHRYNIFPIRRHPNCPACGRAEFEFLRGAGNAWTTRLCGRNAIQITPAGESRLDFSRLGALLLKIGPVRHNEFLLDFAADDLEMVLFPDGRAIIKGTTDETRARSFYAKYVGT